MRRHQLAVAVLDGGSHSYQVSREAGQLKFWQDGELVATVTDAELGAFPTDPMSVITDYAHSASSAARTARP